MILPPTISPRPLNWMSKNFPKRDELLLRTVLAFPKASRMGEESTIIRSMALCPPSASGPLLTVVRYWSTYLVASVFPAPDSPLMRTLWFPCERSMVS